ncbi:MAG: protein kinase [Blastocatellia bacterium]|nr:protein kinase [Blastocatellia bacterium]
MIGLSHLIGQVLDGKYRIETMLGHGGMGAVFRATHLGTERPVAVKVIAPEFMANQEFVERFKREARAAGRLRHPNIINVTDFGFGNVDGERVAYLVMEYLDGHTLTQVLRKSSRLPLGFVVDVVEQTCLAIEKAHQLDIVHRDLKPDNIWLEPNGRGGYNVKVLDFGIAKLKNPSRDTGETLKPGKVFLRADVDTQVDTLHQPPVDTGAPTVADDPRREDPAVTLQDITGAIAPTVVDDGTRVLGSASDYQMVTQTLSGQGTGEEVARETLAGGLTRIGTVIGTPTYMSPEQCRGEKVDARSDLYSLAVIVYQMLAGELPFTGDTWQLIRKHGEEPPPPLAEKRADLPKAVARVVMSALAKNPDERPVSAEMFAITLRAHSEGAGGLFKKALTVYSEHFFTFVPLALRIYLPLFLINTIMLFALYAVPRTFLPEWVLPILQLVLVTVWGVCGLTANVLNAAACTLAMDHIRTGRRISARQVLHLLQPVTGRLLETEIWNTVRVLGGFARMIVPGLAGYVETALYAPIVVLEGKHGRAALDRSRELIKPFRTIAALVQLRHFNTGIVPVFGFPTAFLLGGLAVDLLGLNSPIIREAVIVLVGGGPTLLLAAIQPTLGVSQAMLYFTAKQAHGEKLQDHTETEFQLAETLKPTTMPYTVGLALMTASLLFIGSWFAFQGRVINFAAKNGYNNLIRSLLAVGVPVDAQVWQCQGGRCGHRTPLVEAVWAGHPETVRLLIVRGANIHYRDESGQTVWQIAQEKNHPKIIEALKKAEVEK